MAADEYFLYLCENNKINGILRFYSWDPAALSIGCFFKTRNLNKRKISKDNIKVVRRITGGNLLYHHNELTYSLIIKKGLLKINTRKELYLFIAQKLSNALKKISIQTIINTKINNYKYSSLCINSLSEYELIDRDNKKIAASSQKILKNAFLQHGTIYLNYDFYKTLRYIKSLNNKLYYFFNYKYKKASEKVENKNDIMIKYIKEQFAEDLILTDYEMKSTEKTAIDKLMEEKYSKDEWNFRK